MPDAHKNFAAGTVLTAPSPATSGTSLVLGSGQGASFPQPSTDGPFNVVIFPVGTQPTTANAEIARCTARSTDTLTLTRTQEGTAARTVVVGDQVVHGVTAKTLTDLEIVQVVAVTGNYTLLASDFGKLVEVNGAGGGTVTVPLGLAATYPIGGETRIMRVSPSDPVNFAAAGGVTLNTKAGGLYINGNWVEVRLRRQATNVYVVAGDLV